MIRRARTAAGWLWLGLLAASCGNGPAKSALATSAAPQRRDSLVAMARLEPRDRVTRVGAPEGVIARVVVGEGERVKAGQPLAYLESFAVRLAEREQARLKLERAREGNPDVEAREAEVRAAETEARFREGAAERYRDMFRQGLVSEGEFRDAEARAARSQADLARASASLEQARRAGRLDPREAEVELRRAEALLEQAIVRAPEDGRVLRLVARTGERSGPQGVAQMGETDEMYAVAEVHANDVHLVKPGQRVTFTSPALPAPVDGRVETVGALIFRNEVFGENPTAPENQRVVQVRVRLARSERAAGLTNLEGQARIFLDGATPQ